jgi:hypothetical protein
LFLREPRVSFVSLSLDDEDLETGQRGKGFCRLLRETAIADHDATEVRVAVVAIVDDVAYYSAVGSVWMVWKSTKLGDNSYSISRQEPNVEYSVNQKGLEDDCEAFWARAPLGFLDPDSLRIEPVEVRLQAPGDYVALTSFALPYVQSDLQQFLTSINRHRDPAHLARALARMRLPAFDDALACVAQRIA